MSKKVSSAATRAEAQKNSLEIPPEYCYFYCPSAWLNPEVQVDLNSAKRNVILT